MGTRPALYRLGTDSLARPTCCCIVYTHKPSSLVRFGPNRTFSRHRRMTGRDPGCSLIPKLADPDSCCERPTGTFIAKTYGGPMGYGRGARTRTVAQMSQCLRSLV